MSSKRKKVAVGINCVAPGCRSKIGASTLIRFFKFPLDSKRFQLWCTNAKRQDLALQEPETVRNRYKLCSLHFEGAMFLSNSDDKLINDAVPTIFNENYTDGVYPCVHCSLTFTCKPMQKTHEKYCRARCKPKSLEWIMSVPPIEGTEVNFPRCKAQNMTTKSGAEKPPSYCCPTCNYATRNKTSFNKHKLVHLGIKPQKCSYCDYSCVQKGNLMRHEKIHTGVKPYECTMCGYRCSENGHMKTHMMIHKGVKPFSCDLCDYSCTLAGNLKRHLRLHTGEKKYECEICGYKCREACNLRDHIMVHSGEKPHQCGECGYRCTQASNLKTHMRIHTGFKPYVCSQCGYKTTRSGNLKDHMKTHTGERPYSCSICDYRAAQACHLKNHRKTHSN